MPVEIDSFTTEVTLLDQSPSLTGPQMEALIQELLRRLERKQRDDKQSERNTSFDQGVRPWK